MQKKTNTEDLENDIVSFEQAKELHLIGWNTPSLCGYDIETGELYTCQNYKSTGLYKPINDLWAPTKSQVFRWFRTFFGVNCHIERSKVVVHDSIEIDFMYEPHMRKNIYLEAEDIAINKLIELVKEDNERANL